MIYLAGKISGNENYFDIFAQAAQKLRLENHEVFNPAAANLEGMPLPKIMAYLLPRVCESEAIALIPGWRKSGGAVIEFLLAKYLKLKVIYL